MKKKTFLIIVILGMLFVACKKEKSLSEYMITDWQTSYMKIEMQTANGNDSLQVYEDDFSKEKSILAQSSYKNDGTFSAWYIKLNGSKAGESSGKWKVVGDSLFLEYIVAGKIIKPSYQIKKTTEGLLAKSRYDWDNDGEKDDFLTMKLKDISKTE